MRGWPQKPAARCWQDDAQRDGRNSPLATSARLAGAPESRISKVKKAEILRGYSAFKLAFARGERGSGKLFRYHWTVGGASGVPLVVGFVVPKHTGKAVRRNRVKRMMREAVRMHKSSLEEALKSRQLSATVVFVFKGYEDAGPVPFALIVLEISSALRNITLKL